MNPIKKILQNGLDVWMSIDFSTEEHFYSASTFTSACGASDDAGISSCVKDIKTANKNRQINIYKKITI